jgi:hypothetical protein
MALVERMAGWEDDGSEPANSRTDKVQAHRFFALILEVIAGRETAARARDVHFAVRNTVDASGKSDLQDWNALVALLPPVSIPGSPTALERILRQEYVQAIHTIHLLAEVRADGYDTPAKIRTKLGI